MLSNIDALAGAAQCAAGPPYNSAAVRVQVLLSSGVSCTLTSWAGVCRYIAAYAVSTTVTACPAS